MSPFYKLIYYSLDGGTDSRHGDDDEKTMDAYNSELLRFKRFYIQQKYLLYLLQL